MIQGTGTSGAVIGVADKEMAGSGVSVSRSRACRGVLVCLPPNGTEVSPCPFGRKSHSKIPAFMMSFEYKRVMNILHRMTTSEDHDRSSSSASTSRSQAGIISLGLLRLQEKARKSTGLGCTRREGMQTKPQEEGRKQDKNAK